MIRIVTWNVNSIRQRLPHLLDYLKEASPDILCLQELKCAQEAFPLIEIEDAGYQVLFKGQKAYNGVAILSKHPMEIGEDLSDNQEEEPARYIEAIVNIGAQIIRIASIYAPNGNPIGTDKYTYKKAWLERLKRHAAHLLCYEELLVLAGDYNIIPKPEDAKTPTAWVNDALFQPEIRDQYRALLNLGFTDAIRSITNAQDIYSFWDYQAGAWQKNEGIRIDHLLLSPQAADRLKHANVDRTMRGREKPSDHAPVWIELDL